MSHLFYDLLSKYFKFYWSPYQLGQESGVFIIPSSPAFVTQFIRIQGWNLNVNFKSNPWLNSGWL